MPPMYNYSFAPLQQSYSRNIPGRTRDFQIPTHVRYSSEGPTTPGGPLRPDRRRPWGPTDHSSSGCLCRPVFACLRLPTRGPTRRAISALALDIGFIAPDVLSSRAFGDRPEGGVPNNNILEKSGMLHPPHAQLPRVRKIVFFSQLFLRFMINRNSEKKSIIP